LYEQKGHLSDLASKLGFFGQDADELNKQLVTIDWLEILNQAPLVGQNGESCPLTFDGERLYLHRYWHYETQLAAHIESLAQPINLSASEVQRLRQTLDHLFARNYRYLFDALKQGESLSLPYRKRLVCDYLDVIDIKAMDWPSIDQTLVKAKTIADLAPLDHLIPVDTCLNWQKVAAAVALTKRFVVISGGPGTGKTTTVTKLLAVLLEQAQSRGDNTTIELVAPTGKAAARLTESIGKAVSGLPVSDSIKAQIPTNASTVHRLLGAISDSVEFRHSRDNPLHLDILVVDEASMIDLSMMYRLTEALPKHARLILLGDKDQLASVEAGAVLGDICSFSHYGFSRHQATQLSRLTGFAEFDTRSLVPRISDSLCMLKKSYRFDARSGIGQLAQAINYGSRTKLAEVWRTGFTDIAKFPVDSIHYQKLIQTLVEEYRHFLTHIHQRQIDTANNIEQLEHTAKVALALFSSCRLLCALREGDFGVTGLNQRIEKALSARKLIQLSDELWYSGRPILITQNDYALGLYNGDIGLCLFDDEKAKVFFELPDGSIKSVLASRVPEHETAYAMTIHKSQGSEFSHTLMILPSEFSPILTRELVYTGITRAKSRLSLYSDEKTLERALKVRTTRASGLVKRLGESS
jgi:exodeoxyribonuclease V alpha subunit